MALAKVATDKRHLLDPKGNPFFLLGINYAGYFDRAWRMWESDLFDPDLITRDIRKAQNSGFNSIRLFVHKALLDDIRQNDFAKLDQVLSIVQDHQLLVLLTLNDAHYLNLAQVGELDAKIADRYKDVPTIFAFDLENEPVFYNLAAGIYPEHYLPPIQTSQLVDHYGVRVSRAEALELQRNRRIPGHLDPDKAFYYINALRLFLEYDRAANAFMNQGKGTIVDFMLSDEASPWHKMIAVLDGTVENWLKARVEPVRATGSQHLLNVGWSWMHFAALPANRLLDFQQYHNYARLSLGGFNTNVTHLASLRRAFPNQPIIFGEFGWSNQSSADPLTSQAVHPELTALYEAAMYAYLRAYGFGGAFKWMLNDVDITHNPYEANFGAFAVGDQPKPIRDLIYRFSQDWPAVDQATSFTVVRDSGSGLAYRFDLPQQVTVGGYIYQDDTISWRGEGVAHCFIKREGQELVIDAHGAGQVSVDPWDLVPTWNLTREADLYRVYSDSNRTRQQSFGAGQSVNVDVRPGAKYIVAMGAAVPVDTPPDSPVLVDPNPGEHVLLLADSDQYLPAAVKYIRRFAPDFTFATSEVAGRWAYVSVAAPAERVPDDILDAIRAAGALLVERVVGDTPEDTREILDEMAKRGQRFLTTVAPIPPQEEPPIAPGELPPLSGEVEETYIVRPGDSLGKIATAVYGDARLWRLIFEANRDKLSDPNLVRVGLELRIPEQE